MKILDIKKRPFLQMKNINNNTNNTDSEDQEEREYTVDFIASVYASVNVMARDEQEAADKACDEDIENQTDPEDWEISDITETNSLY